MRAYDRVHPIVSFVTLFSVALIGMFSFDPVISLISLFSAVLFFLTYGIRIKISDVVFYLLLTVLVSLFNPLISHNGQTPLFFVNGRPFTLEALAFGFGISLMIVTTLLWFTAITKIITSEKYIYLFGRFAPRTALTLSVSLRYLPLVVSNFKEISSARKAGGVYSSGSFFERLKERIKVFFQTVSLSVENSLHTAISMRARGYGVYKRVPSDERKMRRDERILLILSVSFVFLFLAFAVLKGESFYYYPEITLPGSGPYTTGYYILFFIICLIPSIYEIKEVSVWKYYLSKI